MTADGAPAAPSQHISTSDPELAAEVLRASYRVSGGVRISGDTEDFHFSQDVLAGHGFSVTRFRTTVTVGYRGPLDGFLCVEQVHAGRLSFDTAGGALRTAAGDVCLVPPHEAWRASSEGIDLAPLLLDQERVAAHAATVSGIAPGALAFTGLQPVSPAAAALWHATVAHVRDDVLGNPAAAAAPLVQAEAFWTLATRLLSTFPNTAVDALRDRPAPGSRGAEPATVRRAVAFVDANAHLPIGLADIADAARLGARALQYAFRRYRGCTPLQYLRRVRMAGAHRDLQAADPLAGDTVAAVAARWGFAHPGAFAVDYRRVHGCSPSHTLRG